MLMGRWSGEVQGRRDLEIENGKGWVGRYAIFGVMWLGKNMTWLKSNIVYSILLLGRVMLKKLKRRLCACG